MNGICRYGVWWLAASLSIGGPDNVQAWSTAATRTTATSLQSMRMATVPIQTRRCTLVPWSIPTSKTTTTTQSAGAPVIGWTLEQRRIVPNKNKAKSVSTSHALQDEYKITVTFADSKNNTSTTAMNSTTPCIPDGNTGMTTVTVRIPTVSDAFRENLSASRWPVSLAGAILALSPSILDRFVGSDNIATNSSQNDNTPTATTAKTGSTSGTTATTTTRPTTTVLELGCGLGLPSLTLDAACRQRHSSPAQRDSNNLRFLLTDKDPDMIDALGQHINTTTTNPVSRMQAVELDWRDVVVQLLENNATTTTGSSGTFTMGLPPALAKSGADWIWGIDVAYNHILLRPLMDTIRACFHVSRDMASAADTQFISKSKMLMVVGQANRGSQWDLYKYIQDGSYNWRTDQCDGPWPGQTQMLLYQLRIQEWMEQEYGPSKKVNVPINEATLPHAPLDEIVPIAVVLHASSSHVVNGEDEILLNDMKLSSQDYIATEKDKYMINMYF